MDTWDVPELRDGLVAGVAAVLVLVAIVATRAASRRTTDTPRPPAVPGVGLVIAGAVGWVLLQAGGVPVAVPVAVASVAAGTALTRGPRPLAALGLLGLLAGAWVLGFHAGIDVPVWTQVLVAVVASVGALAAASCDTTWRDAAVTPALLAISAGAVFLAVPDTERAAVLLGVAAPVALLGFPLRVVRLGGPGAAATVALLAWTAADGARGRPAATIGALAGLGALLGAAPLARGPWRRATAGLRARVRPTATAALVVAIHAGVAVVAARVAGLRSDVLGAAVVAAPALVVGLGAAAALQPGRDTVEPAASRVRRSDKLWLPPSERAR